MTAEGLLDRLRSASLEDRISATYELDYDDFDDPEILAAVRENLGSTNADLLEISIMRLLIRAKDARSCEQVLAILRTTGDELVFSAATLALSVLARERPETTGSILQELDIISRSDLPDPNRDLLSEALAKVFAIAGRRPS